MAQTLSVPPTQDAMQLVSTATAAPPFCFRCTLAWFGWGCFIPVCNGFEEGYYHCDSWAYSCSDNGCIATEDGCFYPIGSLGVDGSILASHLSMMTHEAVLALLGESSFDGRVFRRQCDGAIVRRYVDPVTGAEQRRRTAQLLI